MRPQKATAAVFACIAFVAGHAYALPIAVMNDIKDSVKSNNEDGVKSANDACERKGPKAFKISADAKTGNFKAVSFKFGDVLGPKEAVNWCGSAYSGIGEACGKGAKELVNAHIKSVVCSYDAKVEGAPKVALSAKAKTLSVKYSEKSSNISDTVRDYITNLDPDTLK